jgi:transposase
VHVITTPATQQDNEIVPNLHQALADKDVLPCEHLLDQGYSDSHDVLQAHTAYAIEMVMPMRMDHSWQAQTAKGYALRDFYIDWAAQLVTCPEGHTSGS